MESFSELRRKYKAQIDEMCLMDDNFMSAVLQDKACCELVLRIILNRDDIEVVESKTQYSVTNLHGRAVRLDVFARDKTGAYLNIEVQRNDKDAVPQRARYNSSLIDANVFEKGAEFKDLPETYVGISSGFSMTGFFLQNCSIFSKLFSVLDLRYERMR